MKILVKSKSDVSSNDPSSVPTEYHMDFVMCPENLSDGDLHVDSKPNAYESKDFHHQIVFKSLNDCIDQTKSLMSKDLIKETEDLTIAVKASLDVVETQGVKLKQYISGSMSEVGGHSHTITLMIV